MHDGSLVAVGRFPDDVSRAVEEACASVGLGARFLDAGEDPVAATDSEPAAVLLPMSHSRSAETCKQLRAQTRFASVPVFGISARRTDLDFVSLFTLGGDDLVGSDPAEDLARRLRLLALPRPLGRDDKLAGRAGSAIVASTNAQWRSVVGRALYSGGYSVRFVNSAPELLAESLAQGVRVVIAADDLAREGPLAIATEARRRGSGAAWIVVSPPKRMAATHAAMTSLRSASVVDAYGPPENVLFRANELVARSGPDLRNAPRILYGTAVSFRAAGRDRDDVGFSYNVSEGGVYVRTLAPIEPGQEVWIDMWGPRAERRARLAGMVVWRRPFGGLANATVPPGFGVKLVDGLGGDLDRWREGCRAFAKNMFGTTEPSTPV